MSVKNINLNEINENPDLDKIALTGKIRSGKDEAAQYLTLCYSYWHYKFATLIKSHVDELFPNKRKPRSLYQWYGQTMRSKDPDVFVNYVLNEIEEDRDDLGVDHYVISDLRQPNEYNALINENFTIIRINCNEQIRKNRAKSVDVFNDEDFEHETEQHVDLFPVHYDVYNNGTLRQLYDQFDAILLN